jgi:hypothetical protein
MPSRRREGTRTAAQMARIRRPHTALKLRPRVPDQATALRAASMSAARFLHVTPPRWTPSWAERASLRGGLDRGAEGGNSIGAPAPRCPERLTSRSDCDGVGALRDTPHEPARQRRTERHRTIRDARCLRRMPGSAPRLLALGRGVRSGLAPSDGSRSRLLPWDVLEGIAATANGRWAICCVRRRSGRSSASMDPLATPRSIAPSSLPYDRALSPRFGERAFGPIRQLLTVEGRPAFGYGSLTIDLEPVSARLEEPKSFRASGPRTSPSTDHGMAACHSTCAESPAPNSPSGCKVVPSPLGNRGKGWE